MIPCLSFDDVLLARKNGHEKFGVVRGSSVEPDCLYTTPSGVDVAVHFVTEKPSQEIFDLGWRVYVVRNARTSPLRFRLNSLLRFAGTLSPLRFAGTLWHFHDCR